MTLTDLKKACLQEIEKCYLIAEAKFNVKIPRVPVRFDTRSTKRGGCVAFTSNGFGQIVSVNSMSLSTNLLLLNGMEFVKTVPAHEAAHVIEMTIFKKGGHGNTWKSIMRLLNQAPTRGVKTLERMPTKSRKTMKAFCMCKDNNLFMLTPARFARLDKLSCRSCRSRLSAAPIIQVQVNRMAAEG